MQQISQDVREEILALKLMGYTVAEINQSTHVAIGTISGIINSQDQGLKKPKREFQKERECEFKHGKMKKGGMSMCQEITIGKMAVSNLADLCLGKQTIFSI